MTQSERHAIPRWCRFALVAAVIYALLWGLLYSVDWLGLMPVLDARENLAWAQLIRDGNLPAEPLYRALLYPLVLAAFPSDVLWLPIALGLFCHLLNAVLVGRLAQLIWSDRRAAWLSGLLYAVYPVSLYFSVQVLDITFGLSLFLGALVCLLLAKGRSRTCLWLVAGLLGGLAVLARPNFLPAILLLPLLAFWLSATGIHWCTRTISAFSVVLPLLACLGLQGLVSYQLSGQFRILPWQGAYNLYAANRDGANGKFYMQRVSFDSVPAGMNTTRMESEYLYRNEVGNSEAASIDEMSAYWRERLFEEVQNEPQRWIRLMGRKVVFLLNDWEQYNNLTYAYHKERFALLRYNPLGWGMILIGATLVLVTRWRCMDRKRAVACTLIALGYAAGVLLFFVSARFRLPLAPLLIVCCGGLVGIPLRQLALRHYVLGGLIVLAVASLTFGNWFQANDRSSYVQDALLLASAANQLGDDRAALKFVGEALLIDEKQPTVHRMKMVASFNLWLEAFTLNELSAGEDYWRLLQSLSQINFQDDQASVFIRGVVAWREGDESLAIHYWKRGASDYNSASSVVALDLVEARGSNIADSSGEPSLVKQILGL